jgi:hypothetical protein
MWVADGLVIYTNKSFRFFYFLFLFINCVRKKKQENMKELNGICSLSHADWNPEPLKNESADVQIHDKIIVTTPV